MDVNKNDSNESLNSSSTSTSTSTPNLKPNLSPTSSPPLKPPLNSEKEQLDQNTEMPNNKKLQIQYDDSPTFFHNIFAYYKISADVKHFCICNIPLILMGFSIFSLFSVFLSLNSRSDPKDCLLPYMAESYISFNSFDESHTRFASKYSLHLYREYGLDTSMQPNGIPVLFIPGNAGSYKQTRAIAAQAAEKYYTLKKDNDPLLSEGKVKNLDFFTANFNEDFTAFHGKTLLDQAEYLNDAVKFILSLYSKNSINSHPKPQSVILLGHSMGGIVARTMLTLPNYKHGSVNTILTLSTPHAVPAATFDWDIVKIYNRINDYWRESYSYDLIGRNPLDNVALISIAGGNLDTIVPSDYAVVSSIVPPSNGFTVFTTSMPGVWTSTDHLAIVWCDQVRKAIADALLRISDDSSPSKTLPINERMATFKSVFLSGLEREKKQVAPTATPDIIMKVDDISKVIIPYERLLVSRQLGRSRKPTINLMPIPVFNFQHTGDFLFSLLTSLPLTTTNSLEDEGISAFLCKYDSTDRIPKNKAKHMLDFREKSLSLSSSAYSDANSSEDEFIVPDKDDSGVSLSCVNIAQDASIIPASYPDQYGINYKETFSFLQYNLSTLDEYDFIAIADTFVHPRHGFIIADLADIVNTITIEKDFFSLVANGAKIILPSRRRPMMVNIDLENAHSSLISYKAKISALNGGNQVPIIAPLLRQHISDPIESKFFPNANLVNVSMHGSAPFVPFWNHAEHNFLGLQLWTDPSYNGVYTIHIEIDWHASLANLFMRYRTALIVFPFAIVCATMLIQFNIYNNRGIFLSFGDALHIFCRRYLPLVLLAVSLYSIFAPSELKRELVDLKHAKNSFNIHEVNLLISPMMKNEVFLGLADRNLWFLGPIFILISCGVCAFINYFTVLLLNLVAVGYLFTLTAIKFPYYRQTRSEELANYTSRTRAKAIATIILLIAVATFMPYQFAFIVVFLVHVATCLKATLRLYTYNEPTPKPRNNNSIAAAAKYNFVHYAVTMLIFMIFIIPHNILVLLVWAHNLVVHWWTPFSSHHNLLSIAPIVLLVETMNSEYMIPRMALSYSLITKGFLAYAAGFALLYGMMHQYWMHQIVNIFFGWLLFIHFENRHNNGLVGSSLLDIFKFKLR